jgi:hypothetical protein
VPTAAPARARAELAFDALCLAALLWPALVNGFPLLYFDSGTYLDSAVNRLAAPVDRPLTYGWFIFATSLNASPWLVVVAQAAIALWVMRTVLRVIAPAADRGVAAIAILGTAVLSSAPYFAAQVLPDFFSGLLPLALFLLGAAGARLSRMERAVLFVLVAVGTGSHVSHFAVAAVAVAAMALACAAQRALGTGACGPVAAAAGGGVAQPVPRSGLVAIAAAMALAGTAIALTNQLTYGRFVLAPGSHAFLMARLLADGPAERHLRRACPEAGYRLCAHLDRLPVTATEYLWTGTLLQDTGDWLGSRRESTTIIGRTIAEEPGTVLANAAIASVRQLLIPGTSEQLLRIPEGHGAARAVARIYPGQVSAFQGSLQQRGGLQSVPFRAHAWILWASFWALAAAACALAWRDRRAQPLALPLVATCLAFVAANAFVCGALSGVVDRYQSRVSWPVVFVGLALVASQLRALHPRRPQAR